MLEFLFIACLVIAYAGYCFQGPAATLVVIIIWVAKVLDRGRPDTSLGLLRRISLWIALGFTTLAMLVDWVLFVEDVCKYGQSGPDSTANALLTSDAIPTIVLTLSGVAIPLTLVGKGKGRWRTLFTSVLLLVGSFVVSFLRSCRHVSF